MVQARRIRAGCTDENRQRTVCSEFNIDQLARFESPGERGKREREDNRYRNRAAKEWTSQVQATRVGGRKRGCPN